MKTEQLHYTPSGQAALRDVTLPNPSTPARRSPLSSTSNWRQVLQGRTPGQLIIQFTDQCNASCAQCGMRRENRYPRKTLNVTDVKRMLDSAAKKGISAISFTGGEPMLYLREIGECIQHARSLGIPYVRTGTNGFMFKGHEKADFHDKMARFADTLIEAGVYTFWISIDSASPEMHEKNRGLPGIIPGIEKALPIFHERGLYPSANLGINRQLGGEEKPPPIELDTLYYDHFRRGFRDFYQFVENLGFTIVNACYPMDFEDEAENSVYTATSTDDFVKFSGPEKHLLFKAMFDTIPEFRHKLRIFTPLASLRGLIRQYSGETDDSYACRGGIDFFFVDSRDMNTYPCGFRGEENMGKFWDLDISKIDKKAWCKQCDWECFRDPSELSGPLLDMVHHPITIAKRFMGDSEYRKIWAEDMRYYRACGYFNAQQAPDMKKLAKFKKS